MSASLENKISEIQDRSHFLLTHMQAIFPRNSDAERELQGALSNFVWELVRMNSALLEAQIESHRKIVTIASIY